MRLVPARALVNRPLDTSPSSVSFSTCLASPSICAAIARSCVSVDGRLVSGSVFTASHLGVTARVRVRPSYTQSIAWLRSCKNVGLGTSRRNHFSSRLRVASCTFSTNTAFVIASASLLSFSPSRLTRVCYL